MGHAISTVVRLGRSTVCLLLARHCLAEARRALKRRDIGWEIVWEARAYAWRARR
jgi:hypothetical protein